MVVGMADGHTETGEHAAAGPTNGKPLMTRDSWHEQQKALFLAGDETEGEGGGDATETTEVVEAKPAKPAPKKAPAKPAVEDDDDDDLEEAAATVDDEDEDDDLDVDEDTDDDLEDDDDEDAEETEDGAIAAKAKADPELAKRLAAVRATEQRQRAAMAREREAFENERATWRDQARQVAEAQQRFEKLAARARYNPVAVLRELGLTDDDLEPAAQQIYAHSKAANVKPEHRAAAERAAREREQQDQLAQLQEKHAALEQKLAERDSDAVADRRVKKFLGKVYKAADDTTPLTKQYLEKSPAKAQAALTVTANRLAKKLGQWPEPAQVVLAHEKARRRDLANLGIEVPKSGKVAAKTVAKPAPVQTNGAETTTTTKGLFPSRDEIVAELESGDLDLS